MSLLYAPAATPFDPRAFHPEDFPDLETWERALLQLAAEEEALRDSRRLTPDPGPFPVQEDVVMDPACLQEDAEAATLDREMRRVAAGEAVLNLNLGAALALMKEGRFHRLGFVRWKDYLREHVGMTMPTAAGHLTRARMLGHRPVLLQALIDRRLEECAVSALLEALPLDGSLDADGVRLAAQAGSVPRLQELLKGRPLAAGPVPDVASSEFQEWLLGNTSAVTRVPPPASSDPGPGEWWDLDLTLGDSFDLVEAQRHVGQVAGEPVSRLHALEFLAANFVAGAPLPEWEPGPILPEPPAARDRRDPRMAPDLEVLDRSWEILEMDSVELRISDAFLQQLPRHPHEVQDHIDMLLRCRQRLTLYLQMFLERMQRGGHFRAFGHANLADYAVARLGLRPSTTYELLKRERELRWTGLWDAVWEGTLGISQAMLLVPLVLPDNCDEWVEFARHLTVRRLRDWARVMELYMRADDAGWLERQGAPPGPGESLEYFRDLVKERVTERRARDKARLDGFRVAGEMPPEMLVLWAALLVLAEREPRPKWHRRPPRASATWNFRKLPVEARSFRLQELPEALREWVAPLVDGDGPMPLVDLPPDLAAALQREVGHLRCYRTSEVRKLGGLSRALRTPLPEQAEPRVRTRVWVPDELKPVLEAGLQAAARVAGRPVTREEALALWIRDFSMDLNRMQRRLSRRRRELFLQQDGVCAVPGCTCMAEHEHHIRMRRHGGGDERANRVFLCEKHHQQYLHAGRMRLQGRAPDHLLWWLGIVDDVPRQAFRNDTRVAGPGMLGRRAS